MLTEKQLNSRASILPIEEIYTDAEVNPFTDYDPRRGYKFDYPVRWMQDPSALKRIGIRRLEVTPTTHDFDIYTNIYQPPTVDVDEVHETEWTAVGPLREVLTTTEWGTAKPYWDEYDIEPDAANAKVIHQTNYLVLHNDVTDGTRYYDSDHRLNCTKYQDTISLNVVVRFFAFDSGTGVYDIHDQEYKHNGNLKLNRFQTCSLHHIFSIDDNMGNIIKTVCNNCNYEVFHQDMYTKGVNSEGLDTYTLVTDVPRFTIAFDYDCKRGDLELECRYEDTLGNTILVPFNFDANADSDLNDMLEAFNQPKPQADIRRSVLFNKERTSAIMTLHNVWDRCRLFVHASFSESKGNIIGVNGDRYDAPSKFFHAPTNTSEFNIWFTTDGKQAVLPLYCSFIIELCFLMNYKTAKFY